MNLEVFELSPCLLRAKQIERIFNLFHRLGIECTSNVSRRVNEVVILISSR